MSANGSHLLGNQKDKQLNKGTSTRVTRLPEKLPSTTQENGSRTVSPSYRRKAHRQDQACRGVEAVIPPNLWTPMAFHWAAWALWVYLGKPLEAQTLQSPLDILLLRDESAGQRKDNLFMFAINATHQG